VSGLPVKFWWVSSYYGKIPNNTVLLLCPSKLWGRGFVLFCSAQGSEITASLAHHYFHGFKASSSKFQLVPVTLVTTSYTLLSVSAVSHPTAAGCGHCCGTLTKSVGLVIRFYSALQEL